LTLVMPMLEDILADAQLLVVDAPDHAYIVPGELVAWDEECGGQLWVQIIEGGPYSRFPVVETDLQGGCVKPTAIRCGIGILRCQTGLDRLDRPTQYPTADQQTTDAETMVCDAAKLREVLCEYDVAVEGWRPLGPAGGMFGGLWTFWVAAEFGCPTEPE